jgi:hypothetical protein
MTSSTGHHPEYCAATPPAHTAASNSLTAQLDREWAGLRQCPRALRQARLWEERLTPGLAIPVRNIDDLNQIVAATHAQRGDTGEQLLRALVTLAADDQLAGRLLVQRLLPGVLATSRRYRGLCEHADPIGEAIGALWIAIATFDVERRRGPAAASIISDTMFAAFRRRIRLRSAGEAPVQPRALDDHPATTDPCALVEVADIVGDARRAGVPTDDIDLIRHLVRAGSPGLAARQRQVTPRTVRNHRDRAIQRIRLAAGIEILVPPLGLEPPTTRDEKPRDFP